MTIETKGIEIKNKWLLMFGIILLLIGIGLSIYPQVEYAEAYRNNQWVNVEVGKTYPFQTVGIVLVLAGIVFTALGFFYSPRKTEPTKPSTLF